MKKKKFKAMEIGGCGEERQRRIQWEGKEMTPSYRKFEKEITSLH